MSRMVCTTRPAARSASGTSTAPRLRSMKNSGGESTLRPEGLFDLLRRDLELSGDGVKGVPREEPVQHVFQTSAALVEDRLAEAATRVNHDVSGAVGGQPDPCGIAVVAPGDALQVTLDDVGEHALPVPDHDEVAHHRI